MSSHTLFCITRMCSRSSVANNSSLSRKPKYKRLIISSILLGLRRMTTFWRLEAVGALWRSEHQSVLVVVLQVYPLAKSN